MEPMNWSTVLWLRTQPTDDLVSFQMVRLPTPREVMSHLLFQLATAGNARISKTRMLGFFSLFFQCVNSVNMRSNMVIVVLAKSPTSAQRTLKGSGFMTSPPVTNASDCDGCPQSHQTPPNGGVASEAPGRRLRPLGQGWVSFTGGPPESHLATLAHVLPADTIHVVIHADGSIEYDEKRPGGWEPPSPIDGFERDEKNPRLFRPLWRSCQLRSFSLVVKENCQCLDVIAKCGNPRAANVDEIVKHTDCVQCEHRLSILVPPKPKKKTLHSRSI